MRAVSLGLFLFVTWLLLSGHYTALLLGLGAVSVVLVVAIAHRMDVIDHEGHPVQLTTRFFGYWAWLMIEIIKANIDVAKRIWTPSLPVDPVLIRLRTSQPSELGQVIYANSITLTPGTVSVRLAGDEVLVHAVASALADDLAGGEMDRRVTRLEAGKI